MFVRNAQAQRKADRYKVTEAAQIQQQNVVYVDDRLDKGTLEAVRHWTLHRDALNRLAWEESANSAESRGEPGVAQFMRQVAGIPVAADGDEQTRWNLDRARGHFDDEWKSANARSFGGPPVDIGRDPRQLDRSNMNNFDAPPAIAQAKPEPKSESKRPPAPPSFSAIGRTAPVPTTPLPELQRSSPGQTPEEKRAQMTAEFNRAVDAFTQRLNASAAAPAGPPDFPGSSREVDAWGSAVVGDLPPAPTPQSGPGEIDLLPRRLNLSQSTPQGSAGPAVPSAFAPGSPPPPGPPPGPAAAPMDQKYEDSDAEVEVPAPRRNPPRGRPDAKRSLQRILRGTTAEERRDIADHMSEEELEAAAHGADFETQIERGQGDEARALFLTRVRAEILDALVAQRDEGAEIRKPDTRGPAEILNTLENFEPSADTGAYVRLVARALALNARDRDGIIQHLSDRTLNRLVDSMSTWSWSRAPERFKSTVKMAIMDLLPALRAERDTRLRRDFDAQPRAGHGFRRVRRRFR